MIKKRHAFFFLLLVTGLLASQTQAAMMIYGYHPTKHDRFYAGADRDFIGEGYDWSGVGVAWKQYVDGYGATQYDVKWITMISDRYFLTSKYTDVVAADIGDVTFYEGNSLSGPSHTYTIDSIIATYGDLALGRLTEDIDPDIAYYPIFKYASSKDYVDLLFFAYGHGGSYPSTTTNYDPRMGRNQIDSIVNIPIGGKTTSAFTYDFLSPPSGLGDDECLLKDGDFGAPSFVVYDGELALIGIHGRANTSSVDILVSDYSNNIQACCDAKTVSPIAGDTNNNGIVDEDDAALMAANWLRSTGARWAQGDFNGDKAVNDVDAAILAANWHRTASSSAVASTSMPEPGTAKLLLLGLLILIGRAITTHLIPTPVSSPPSTYPRRNTCR